MPESRVPGLRVPPVSRAPELSSPEADPGSSDRRTAAKPGLRAAERLPDPRPRPPDAPLVEAQRAVAQRVRCGGRIASKEQSSLIQSPVQDLAKRNAYTIRKEATGR